MTQQESGAAVQGMAAPGFEPLREAFERNFAEHGECGAAVAVYVDGIRKVDLWGGVADPGSGRQWDQDTLCLVYSATKGATAIVCHQLAERGVLDLDAPVALLWPEFAAGGKEGVTVRMLLSHRAGLPVIDAKLTREQLLAGRPVAEAVAQQTPVWAPGTAHGYHALTYGWLLGEVVRRATGQSLGRFFAENVAGPLGLDFFIGLPGSEAGRLAKLVAPAPPDPSFMDQITDPDAKARMTRLIEAALDPGSLMSRALSSNGAMPAPDADTWNDPSIHAAEIPAANGIADARSLARMYAACIGAVDGVRLLGEKTLADAVVEQSSGEDRVIITPSRFGSGFMLDAEASPLPGESAFGHYGAGGAVGFADRATGVAFGYVPNRGSALSSDPRGAGLIAAVEQSLAR